MPISLKANSDGSAEILNGVVSALKINTDGSLEGTTIDGKLNKSENINLGVSVTASGTAVDFVGIPEGVKRITVILYDVGSNGSSPFLVQLGTTLSEITGYASSASNGGSAITSTIGLLVVQSTVSTATYRGGTVIDRVAGNKWVSKGLSMTSVGALGFSTGVKELSGELGIVRLTTVNGTDQFDSGTINIAWEF